MSTKKWVKGPGKRITCQCPTPDDWYPTVGGKVKLSVIRLSNGLIRTCIWGGDDFGLEKDESIGWGQARENAEAIPVPIRQRWLRENGFGPA